MLRQLQTPLRTNLFAICALLVSMISLTFSLLPSALNVRAASSEQVVNAINGSTFAYQGTLRDGTGKLLTGSYNLTFSIYDQPSGGTILHKEVLLGVVVRDGNFNVVLGADSSFPINATVFASPTRYIGIAVHPDPEMAPRQEIHPVPWALNANSALTVPDRSITKAKLAVDALLPDFGGRAGSYPYLVHLALAGIPMGSVCWGYVPGDPLQEPGRPQCAADRGLDAATSGVTFYSASGNGFIRATNGSMNCSGQPCWGYSYSYFLSNPQPARSITIPILTCNDVAVYISTGSVVPSDLGTSNTLVFHHIPGNSASSYSDPCQSTSNPTIDIPGGSFRLSLMTRGGQNASSILVGRFDGDFAPVGNWIVENQLSIDWSSLRTYLGEQ